jgi:hypothetical protein
LVVSGESSGYRLWQRGFLQFDEPVQNNCAVGRCIAAIHRAITSWRGFCVSAFSESIETARIACAIFDGIDPDRQQRR